MKTALLLSGGMDSICIAYWKRPALAITINYGQLPAEAEIRASAAVCKSLKLKHHIIRVDCSALGSGDMAGSRASKAAPVSEWWPYRNQLLITLAAMYGINHQARKIMIGSLVTDASHADGRPEFISAASDLLRLQEGAVTVSAPAIALTASELVRKSRVPLEILGWAHSCHVSNSACGQCRGCVKHYHTMEALGLPAY